MAPGPGPASNETQAQPATPPTGGFAPAPGRRASRLALVLAVVAVLLGGAALAVSLLRKPASPGSPAVVASSPSPTVPQQQLFVEDADRALCEAIGPAMRENDEQTRAFAQYKNGSPEQQNDLPGYRRFTEEWAGRMQHILNDHADPPRYLTRTLQRFIDDMLLYVELDSLSDEVGVNTWKLSLTDYSGPSRICRDLGLSWQ